MRIRKTYGTSNIVGKNIKRLRDARKISLHDFVAKLQVDGVDIDESTYSKLEGQLRTASDREIYAIAKILKVKLEDLFDSQ